MGTIKSLVELCMDTCQRHISQLTSFGDADFLIPRERVHDLLSKINNPQQLHQIEINSPHLQTETAEYWKRLIQKEFPVESKEKNYTPKNPGNWYKMYEKYSKERELSQKEAEERMRQQFQGLQQKKDTRVSHIVEQKFLPRPPKTGRVLGTGQRGTNYEKATGNLSFSKGSRTSNALQKARRQASEYRLIRQSLTNPFRATPTGTVKAAPAGMVDAKRIASQPAFRASSSLRHSASRVLPPAKPSNPGMDHASRPPQFISDSENEDDVFDDAVPRKERSKPLPPKRDSGSMVSSSSVSKRGSKPVRRSGLLSAAPRPKATITRVSATNTTPKSDTNTSSVSVSRRPAVHTSDRPTSVPKSRQIERPKGEIERPAPKAVYNAPESEPSPRHGPASPPGPQSPPLMPKKRKAVDIFMPLKKRKN